MLLRDVRLDGAHRDVLIRDGNVAQIFDRGALPVTGAADVVDCAGAVLLPGLTDEHVHLSQWAAKRRRIDVSAARSADEVVRCLRAAAEPGQTRVLGHGFRDGLWAEPVHRDLLDAEFGHREVVVVSQDLHAAWLNSAALQRFGITSDTGLLQEGAAMEVITAAGTPGPEVMDNWVLHATEAAAARGVTSVVELEYAPHTDWVRRARTRAPALRVRVGVWSDFFADVLASGLRSGDAFPDIVDDVARDRVRLGPLKLFADGSLGTRTAYCSEHYPDGGHGIQRLFPDQLRAYLIKAQAHGIDVTVHAIGDAAVTLALDGFAATGCRGRMEHAQQVSDADLPRFAALGITASIQPRHVIDDRDACDLHWAGAAALAYRYADLAAHGAHLVLGSDAPVAALDPWDAIASAVHHSLDDRPPWHPDQHLPLRTALAAASGGRHTVQVGEVADLVLTPDHPATVLTDGGPDALRQMTVLGTLVGGRWTHRAGV